MATPTTLPGAFTAGDVLTAANMNALRGAFRILQVVSGQTTTDFTTTSTSYTDWSGISASITPSSTDSKILVLCNASSTFNNGNADTQFLQVVRGASTVIAEEVFGSLAANASGGHPGGGVFVLWLDSPNTTSSTTYKAQVKLGSGASVSFKSGAIILMEVSA